VIPDTERAIGLPRDSEVASGCAEDAKLDHSLDSPNGAFERGRLPHGSPPPKRESGVPPRMEVDVSSGLDRRPVDLLEDALSPPAPSGAAP
jgi:hypothetical protein